MASGMKAAGAYPTTNTTAAAANEAAIAAADPAATVMADGARAGADRQISRSSLAATASAAHTHAYMHTCIHAHMHTCIHAHAHMHTCIHAYMHACMHAYTHIRMHAYMHVRMYAYMHVCMYACMHACMHTCMYARMHACTHARAYTRVCTYAYMHVHVYMCMYTRMYICMYVDMHLQRLYWEEPASTIRSARSCTCIGRSLDYECAISAVVVLGLTALSALGLHKGTRFLEDECCTAGSWGLSTFLRLGVTSARDLSGNE